MGSLWQIFWPCFNRYIAIGAVLFFGGWLLVPFIIGILIMIVGWLILIFSFFYSFYRLIPGHDKISAYLKKELKPHRNWLTGLWQEFKKR